MKCDAFPDTEDDFSTSMLLSDHFLKEERLKEIGAFIAGGGSPKTVADAVMKALPPEMRQPLVDGAKEMKARMRGVFDHWHGSSPPPDGANPGTPSG
jgi:hypothetical protein